MVDVGAGGDTISVIPDDSESSSSGINPVAGVITVVSALLMGGGWDGKRR